MTTDYDYDNKADIQRLSDDVPHAEGWHRLHVLVLAPRLLDNSFTAVSFLNAYHSPA